MDNQRCGFVAQQTQEMLGNDVPYNTFKPTHISMHAYYI